MVLKLTTKQLAFAISTFASYVFTAPTFAEQGLTVDLGMVKIVGIEDVGGTQEFFGGIPYAEPPLGDLRFRPSQPKTEWAEETFNATDMFSPMCLQDVSWLGLPFTLPTSEDCLTINVARPAGTTSDSKLPVMAWIYGGSFTGGGTLLYNGSTIVAQSISRETPIIYVTFNYRLGALGFPIGDDATQEDVLNLGLKDQRLALQWVQENIEAFGGDATKVTVFGESAGAISISTHMLSPSFSDLARGAILQSGSGPTTPLFNGTTAEKNGDWGRFVTGVPECANTTSANDTSPDDGTPTSSLDCLRNVENATVLLEAWTLAGAQSSSGVPFRPTLDPGSEDAVVPFLPSRVYAQGRFARVPFISGVNRDESTLFSNRERAYTTDEIRQILLNSITPSELAQDELEAIIEQVLDAYPDDPAVGSPYGTGNETFGLGEGYKRWSSIAGDKDFQANRRRMNRLSVEYDDVRSWGYQFTDPQSEPSMGVGHGAEVAYIFSDFLQSNLTAQLGVPANRTGAFDLSEVMVDYWISFAVEGDPNDGRGRERPVWGEYSAEAPTVLQLENGNTTNVADDYREGPMDVFLDNPIAFRH